MDDNSTAPTGVEAATESDETEAPAADTEELETETNAEADAENTEDGEGDGEPAEEIEFDFGGNKLKVPKGAIPEDVAEKLGTFTKSTWADYTRKSQDVAERVKSVEARESAVEKLGTLNGEILTTFSRGLALKDEISQLQQVNLPALWQSDPDQARRVSDSISRKQAELSSIANAVSTKEQELTNAQQSDVARRMDEGKQLIERRVKGFKADDVVAYAIKAGIPERDARAWALNPLVTEFAHKAMLYDRMQAAAKPKPAPVPAAEPVRPMKGKAAATATKDPDKMSMEEWMKWQDSVEKRKRG